MPHQIWIRLRNAWASATGGLQRAGWAKNKHGTQINDSSRRQHKKVIPDGGEKQGRRCQRVVLCFETLAMGGSRKNGRIGRAGVLGEFHAVRRLLGWFVAEAWTLEKWSHEGQKRVSRSLRQGRSHSRGLKILDETSPGRLRSGMLSGTSLSRGEPTESTMFVQARRHSGAPLSSD